MNHARDDFLSHTALTDDEHAEIGWRYLEGNVKHMVQSLAVTYDVVPLFDGLKF